MAGPWEKFQAQPVQDVEAPKAAPWLKFQPPADQPTNSPIPEVVRIPLGVAQGVAEAMNPINIPHGIETLARATVNGNDPKVSGFFNTVLDHLKRADRDAVIPAVPVDKIAAGARTAMDLMNENPLDKTPSFSHVKDVFNQELLSQKNYNQDFINPTAEKVGSIGAGVASLASLGKDLANAAGLSPKLSAAAEKMGFNSLKPIKSVAQGLQQSEQVAPIGRQLLNEGVLKTTGGIPPSWDTMLERVNTKMDNYGKTIGHFADSADKAHAADSSIRGVLISDIQSAVENKLIPALKEAGEDDVAKKISSFVDGNLKAAGPGGELGYAQTTKILKTIAKRAQYNKLNPDPASDAFKDLYTIVNDQRVSGIEEALSKAGSQDEMSTFMNAKTGYGNLAEARKILQKTTAGQAANRLLSLSDYGVGMTAAGGQFAHTGDPKAILTGLAAALANKAIRTRGSQGAAALFERLSQNPDPNTLRGLINIAGTSAGSANMLPQNQIGPLEIHPRPGYQNQRGNQ